MRRQGITSGVGDTALSPVANFLFQYILKSCLILLSAQELLLSPQIICHFNCSPSSSDLCTAHTPPSLPHPVFFFFFPLSCICSMDFVCQRRYKAIYKVWDLFFSPAILARQRGGLLLTRRFKLTWHQTRYTYILSSKTVAQIDLLV